MPAFVERDGVPAEDAKLAKETKLTLTGELRQFLSQSHVKRMFNLGNELFSAASPFLDEPTWWNAARSVIAMGKVMVDDTEMIDDEYFAGDEWAEPYSTDFNQTLLRVLQKFQYEKIKTSNENMIVRIVTLPCGVKAGWTCNIKNDMIDHIYVETEGLDEARDEIKKLLWEQFKGKSLVMRKNNRVILTGDEARVVFEVDNTFETKLSKRAIEYASYLKKPLDANVSRSVMFYGPPGTGKSTLARTLVELMNLRSFRIRIGDLGELDNSTLFEAINIFEPDAVILDDFDRTSGQAQLLETLEFFQQKVKLVIVTVNNKNRLDDALLRPGRIDELILIDKMDEEVVKHVLGEYVDGYDLVKDWPIAFINEYVVRRTYLSVKDAADSVTELANRVAELDDYRESDKDDIARMMATFKKKMKKGRKNSDVHPPVVVDEDDDEDYDK
jgi:SpoVK/Ycf46/Vps4 family AAA+-type ATPase